MINVDQLVQPDFSAPQAFACRVCRDTHLVEVEVPVRHVETCPCRLQHRRTA